MPKPRHKKRKFIDPKKERTATFKLIHRSQKDPLAADENAPQHLLQPLLKSKNDFQKEQRDYGVFFDDDYNYLQHLKDRKDEGPDFSEMDKFLLTSQEDVQRLLLPSSVFASKTEEKVGLLNKAAPRPGPRPDWDPDIVAALDDDFDFEDPENELEDDFMKFANGSDNESSLNSGEENEYSSDNDYDSDFIGGRSDDEAFDNVPELPCKFNDEETISRFTNYSLSSSIIRRNTGLSNLDDHFEKFFEEYDDVNVGALDCEDIEGPHVESSEIMKGVIKDYEKLKISQNLESMDADKTLNLAQKLLSQTEKYDLPERIVINIEDKWDCESILSTYSNIYNHPKLISERKPNPIIISSKTGMPKNVLGRGLTADALKRLDAENGTIFSSAFDTKTLASRVSEFSFRNKHETLEEKKARKEGMKEIKRERRIEKKANRLAFKEEKVRQEKIQLNLRKNVPGRKIV